MKYLTKRPGSQVAEVESAKITLKDLQREVEGLVTCPYVPGLNEAGITMWANDEGLLLGMEPNLRIMMHNFFEPMFIVGPVVFTSSDKNGNTRGLSKTQLAKVREFLAEYSV
jgi:hypothetical protein